MKRKWAKAWLAAASAVVVSFSASGGTAAATGEVSDALGNVDGKDGITSGDALIVLQAATSKVRLTAEQAAAADVDGQNGVTPTDALLILQYATRKIDRFPAQDSQPDPDPRVIQVAGTENSWFGLDASADDWNRQVCGQLEAVEKELDYTFQLKKYTPGQLVESCIKADKAGTKIADLINADLPAQSRMARAGILRDLNAVNPTFSDTSDWKHRVQTGGAIQAVFPVLYGVGSNAQVVYFNKELARRVGTSDTELYQMVTDGTWTFNLMQKLSSKALKDIDGEPGYGSNDQYGFTGLDFYHAGFSIFKAQDGYFTGESANGGFSYALAEAKSIQALRFMQICLLKDRSVFHSANSDDVQNMIYEGQVLFVGGSLADMERFGDSKQAWGILPYPKADQDAAYRTPVLWSNDMEEGLGGFSIPNRVSGARVDEIAKVMETIGDRFYQIRQIGAYAPWKESLADDQTENMLDIIQQAVNTADTDILFDLEHDLGAGGMPTIRFLMNTISNDPATRVNEVKEEVAAHLEKYLAG